MRRLTKSVLGAATTLVLLAAAGCGSDSSGDGSTADGTDGLRKVSVGIIPVVDVAPLYLGVEKGFFAERNIELSLEAGQGGAAIIPGVVSGQFQFGSSNVTSLMLARHEGLPVKIVVSGNASTGQDPDISAVVVKGDSDIKSAKDLEGKTVAVNTLNNLGDTTVRQSIRKDGGDPDEVEFVELGFPDMPAAVANGQIDAAWVVEPFVAISKSQGDRVVAWNLVDTAPDLMLSGYFTSEKLLQEDPELVEDFVAAVTESQEYAMEHPEEARAIVKTYTEIADDVLAALTLPVWTPAVNRESTQTLADLAMQDGLVDQPVDVAALLH
ncbi:MAG: Nitrate transporter substrate-binding protein [Nocardioides sp.]|jgi:NitT/TauT family transport system substrate-binding protein|uniref:ABC transporter substrate-binding protein n=1 Tax=Nocardioides sp. TaxID=35761 RepID=UPI00260DDC5D|nr:ABC transporter substrate-binding protein [Nocardioides sp.]MCW2835040.1 Nitrate transporter substrate-binding protein [Nocardioides sp.]